MRFILNFIFFGILFYLIWMFFPEAFTTLVSWANHIVAFFRDLFMGITEKVQHHATKPTPASPAWLIFLPFFMRRDAR
jgi:hypothetical protein